MEDKTRVFQWKELHEFVTRIFAAVGMPEEDAVTEANMLMWANLRGVDSHGVVRVPWYVENVRNGVMNPRPTIEVTLETPAVALIEADRAFGPVITTQAADLAIRKAREVGIGWILIRNHTHQGAMGPYVQRIAEQDMAGLLFACARPNMVPFGARVAGVNNNPFALSVPAKRHPPLLLDMATSVVALGKVLVARDRGVQMPEGWGVDEDGNPTTEPGALAALLPVGGPKGSGMALLFECMGSLMASNPLLLPVLSGELSETKTYHVGRMARHNQNSVIAAIDISRFTDITAYKNEVDDLIDHLKRLPRADGFDAILMPGEREERVHTERWENGIPVAEGTLAALEKIATELNIPFLRPAG
ncbi:MAG: Ldh family oxidoreductase [Dehalococcoidia bacterium]|nr:Ldh family oxidoreductase [Dehalococcoidia bacterium]